MRSLKTYNRKYSKGFTLIEMLVTIGLLTVLGGVTVMMGIDSISRSATHSERDLIVMFLTSARAKAMANIDESPHGVHIGSSTVTIFSGNSYVPSDPSNRSTDRNSSVQVTGSTEIVFEQLSGRALGSGTTTLTHEHGNAGIAINSEGRINW